MIKVETNEELDKQINEVLKKLDKAVEHSRKFYAVEVGEAEYHVNDFFEMALAFDTVELLMAKFEFLLAKRYKINGWERVVERSKEQIEKLENDISYWEKREFPPRS